MAMVTMTLWLCCDTGDKTICMCGHDLVMHLVLFSLLTFLYADQPLVSLLVLFLSHQYSSVRFARGLLFFLFSFVFVLLLSCHDSHIQGTHRCIFFLRMKGERRATRKKKEE